MASLGLYFPSEFSFVHIKIYMLNDCVCVSSVNLFYVRFILRPAIEHKRLEEIIILYTSIDRS